MLEGFVLSKDTNTNSIKGIAELKVRAECIFLFKPPLVGPPHNKVIFSETLHLELDKKVAFHFTFGSKALPPSFLFDPSEWTSLTAPFGVIWQVSAFLWQNGCESSQTISSFLVSYSYSSLLLQSQPRWGIRVQGVSDAFKLFRQDISLAAQLENPIISGANLQINLLLSDVSSQHRIKGIRVVLRQKINICILNAQRYKYKKYSVLYDEQPSPSYVHPVGHTLKYDLVVDCFTGLMAKNYPVNPTAKEMKEEGVLVSSTCFTDIHSSGFGVEILYQVEVKVDVVDDDSGRNTTLKANLPLVVSNGGSISSSVTESTFLSSLSIMVEDLNDSCITLEILAVEWEHIRYNCNGRGRMVTQSSDHALVLLNMLNSVEVQLSILKDNKTHEAIPLWPQAPLTFNTLLREIELLIRAYPTTSEEVIVVSTAGILKEPVQSLLSSVLLFMNLSKTLVIAWIESRNFEGHQFDIDTPLARLRSDLLIIAKGGDHFQAANDEKPDYDLIDGIRRSLL